MITRDPNDEGLKWTSLPNSSILSLLNGDNFGFFNREIAHKIGLHEAIIFSELVARYQFLEKNHNLTEIDGEKEYFSFTQPELEERTCIGRKSQDTALKKLISLGWIEKKNFGLPMKRFFRIHIDKIWEIHSIKKKFSKLSQKDNQGSAKGTTKHMPKGQPLYTYKTSNKTKEKDKKESPSDPPPLQFIKYPKINKMTQNSFDALVKEHGKEVVEEYLERLNDYADIDPARFKKYLNHATVIKRWIKRDEDSQKKSREGGFKKVMEICNRIKEKNINLIRSRNIEILTNSIVFTRGSYYKEISFEEKDAIAKIESEARKIGLKL